MLGASIASSKLSHACCILAQYSFAVSSSVSGSSTLKTSPSTLPITACSMPVSAAVSFRISATVTIRRSLSSSPKLLSTNRQSLMLTQITAVGTTSRSASSFMWLIKQFLFSAPVSGSFWPECFAWNASFSSCCSSSSKYTACSLARYDFSL